MASRPERIVVIDDTDAVRSVIVRHLLRVAAVARGDARDPGLSHGVERPSEGGAVGCVDEAGRQQAEGEVQAGDDGSGIAPFVIMVVVIVVRMCHW